MRHALCLMSFLSGLACAQLGPLAAAPSSIPSLGMGSPTPVVAPKAFQMRQSYSLSYASSGNASYSQGLYLNQMSYRLADPLTLNLDIGIANPLHSSGLNSNDMQKAQLLLPRVGLDYRPTESTLLSLNYSRLPASSFYSPYGPWGERNWP